MGLEVHRDEHMGLKHTRGDCVWVWARDKLGEAGQKGARCGPGQKKADREEGQGTTWTRVGGGDTGTRLSFSREVPKRVGESNSSRGPIPEPCSERTERVGGKMEREDLRGGEGSTVKASASMRSKASRNGRERCAR
jgi:hypothetical protein